MQRKASWTKHSAINNGIDAEAERGGFDTAYRGFAYANPYPKNTGKHRSWRMGYQRGFLTELRERKEKDRKPPVNPL